MRQSQHHAGPLTKALGLEIFDRPFESSASRLGLERDHEVAVPELVPQDAAAEGIRPVPISPNTRAPMPRREGHGSRGAPTPRGLAPPPLLPRPRRYPGRAASRRPTC